MNEPLAKKRYPIGDLAGKPHFVGHHDHGHAFLGEHAQSVQHFADQLGIQSRCDLVKRQQTSASPHFRSRTMEP